MALIAFVFAGIFAFIRVRYFMKSEPPYTVEYDIKEWQDMIKSIIPQQKCPLPDCCLKTEIYAADVSVLSDPALYEAAYAAVSPVRREKVDRLRFSSDKYLSLGVELLLQYGLNVRNIAAHSLFYGPQGKPLLVGENLFFSLSHSGIWALCAISDCEVGCDVQQVDRVDIKLSRRFAPAEQADILSQTETEAQTELFYRYWTLKESFAKATGLGLKLPLQDYQIILEKTISVSQLVNDRTYYFQEFSALPGYCCAVCTAEETAVAQPEILDLRKLCGVK